MKHYWNKTLVVLTLAITLAGCSTFPYQKQYVETEPGITNAVYAESDLLQRIQQTAKDVNARFVPAPFNGIVDLSLAIIAAGSTIVLGFLNRKLRNEREAADILAGTVAKNNLGNNAIQNAEGSSKAAYDVLSKHIDNNTNI